MVNYLQGVNYMVKKNLLSQNIHNSIKSYSNDLKSANIPYSKLIIFGSHAKGTAKPWSDIDLCVVSDAFSDDLHGEMVRLLKIRSNDSLDIEPHPMRSEDLDNPWDPLSREIKIHGVEIF